MTPPCALDPQPTPAATCELLAHALQRLSPDRRDPERFHLDRSELRRLGRRLGQVRA